MNIQRYLDRIKYAGPQYPNIDNLVQLHRAHLLAVPFENLSILFGETIQLELQWLYDKIVTRNRGGFCYELNGLFAELLRELGFDVSLLSARVHQSQGEGFGPEFDHLVLQVNLEDRWLVDVGFGDSFREPLKLDKRDIQVQCEGSYQIIEYGNYLLYQRFINKHWHIEYIFSQEPRELTQFKDMCHFHQTSPKSSFPKNLICSIASPDGRISLSGNKLIATSNGERKEKLIKEADFTSTLERYFGISVESITI